MTETGLSNNKWSGSLKSIIQIRRQKQLCQPDVHSYHENNTKIIQNNNTKIIQNNITKYITTGVIYNVPWVELIFWKELVPGEE